MIHAIMWINLENIMLGERSHTQRPPVSIYMGFPEEANTESESRLVVARRQVRGNGERLLISVGFMKMF